MKPSTGALLLFLSGAHACSGTGERSEDSVASMPRDSVADAIASAFGTTVSMRQNGGPGTYHGDFNADGLEDLLVVVEVTRGTDPLPDGVRVLQPWPGGGQTLRVHESTEGAMSLAVLHGAVPRERGEAFLLYDPEPISILATDAAREAFVAASSEVASLNAEMGRLTNGDVFVLPTEAGIDTFIYWSGSTYRAFQPLESP
jgi:hypothetical protein